MNENNVYNIKTETANQNNSLYQRALSGLQKAGWDTSVLKKNWFSSQPKLIICGGGHVSQDLVKIASGLDFSITVIDDRKEYANEERFCLADKVICDTYDHLEKYLEDGAYYVVVTYGHKEDLLCVETIVRSSYQYLGMIGSKTKVRQTFEKLRQAGITEEQIQTISAPIGVDIKAITPYEIAISILAQIIMEKNTRQTASVSKELLDSKEAGTLCIIIEKKGSAPRGIGSMMLVTKTDTIDSIGGGSVEYTAIQDARNCTEVMTKEYNLSREDIEKMGMICGGSNKILFIPL